MSADDRIIRTFRAALIDALDHARNIAARGSEATEGTPDIFLFEAVRTAIANFTSDDPAMKALASAAVRSFR